MPPFEPPVDSVNVFPVLHVDLQVGRLARIDLARATKTAVRMPNQRVIATATRKLASDSPIETLHLPMCPLVSRSVRPVDRV